MSKISAGLALGELQTIPLHQTLVAGVDVGRVGYTSERGFAAMLVSRTAAGFEIETLGSTERLDYYGIDSRLSLLNVTGRVLVAIDGPLTPRSGYGRSRGRSVEKRMSRGDFSNSRRGLQPSSITVPQQGARVHERAMELRATVERRGIPYFEISAGTTEIRIPPRGIIEVLPKLTVGLIAPRALITGPRPREGMGHQIENWLFPYLFLSEIPANRPAFQGVRGVFDLYSGAIGFNESVREETQRIWATHRGGCDSAVNAFISAFQAALAVVGLASFVGCTGPSEGYITVPGRWHADWEAVWVDTARENDSVARICPSSDGS